MNSALLLLCGVLVVGVAFRIVGGGGGAGAGRALLAVLLPVSFAAWLSAPRPGGRKDGEPTVHRERGYVGSGACAECHPGPSHSFGKTYHRTMTRRIQDIAPSDLPTLPARLEARGRTFEVSASPSGEGVEVLGPNLHAIARGLLALPQGDLHTPAMSAKVNALFGGVPSERHEIVLVTGSHHYLAFWVEGGPHEELRQLPFVWLVGERVWIPREEAFLAPPESLPHIERWNGSCIQCHAVAGMPQESNGSFATKVAELGVTCEACHGAGAQHARAMRNPLTRYLARHDPGPELQRLNPEHLSSPEASAICGQCHAYFAPARPDEWWESGFTEVATKEEPPGLSGRLLLEPDRPEVAEQVGLSRALGSIFWPDGTVIVGGREYNGLIRSACYSHDGAGPKLGCLDCHSMHNSEPNDQLKANWQARCGDCHRGYENGPDAHSRHPTEVDCASCHMPRTSYALLEAIASHRISVPSASGTSPPSACALCHTDLNRKALEKGFAELYGGKERRTEEDLALLDPKDPPLAMELALSGNALQRAVLARAVASSFALRLTGPSYPRAVLRALTEDPYPAVRRIAQRSLAELDAQPGLSQDHVELPSPELLAQLSQKRDNSPITISE